jgi:vacuolar iron transporter family protein
VNCAVNPPGSVQVTVSNNIERASYRETRNDTTHLVENDIAAAISVVKDVFEPYNLPKQTLEGLASHLSQSSRLVDFLMHFQHYAPEPASSQAVTSAITIALAYFLGGLIPLIPYFAVGERNLYLGLYISIGVMAVALFTFGYVKTCIVCGWKGWHKTLQGLWGAIQMVIIGGAAAGAAMGLVKAFNSLAD